jgi:formylmethanofuran dehydrogenase subunit E
MNNDLYYLKYLKYKTKYLNEKNKIEGGSFFNSCDSTIIFNNLKQIDTFQYIEDLIKNIIICNQCGEYITNDFCKC